MAINSGFWLQDKHNIFCSGTSTSFESNSQLINYAFIALNNYFLRVLILFTRRKQFTSKIINKMHFLPLWIN
eukprot:snap_masked-scaffold_6-processed-gene-16.37-mRNA-1 protein AED:1.00 eAED:1.00 QI:0/0/0/0/1/1/4/0/71